MSDLLFPFRSDPATAPAPDGGYAGVVSRPSGPRPTTRTRRPGDGRRRPRGRRRGAVRPERGAPSTRCRRASRAGCPRVVAATKTGWSPWVSSTSTSGRPPPGSQRLRRQLEAGHRDRGRADRAAERQLEHLPGGGSCLHPAAHPDPGGGVPDGDRGQLGREPVPGAPGASPRRVPGAGGPSRSARVQAAGAGAGPVPDPAGDHERAPLVEGERQAGVGLGAEREAAAAGRTAADRGVEVVGAQPPGAVLQVRGEHVRRPGVEHRRRPHRADRVERVGDRLVARCRRARGASRTGQPAVRATAGQPGLVPRARRRPRRRSRARSRRTRRASGAAPSGRT